MSAWNLVIFSYIFVDFAHFYINKDWVSANIVWENFFLKRVYYIKLFFFCCVFRSFDFTIHSLLIFHAKEFLLHDNNNNNNFMKAQQDEIYFKSYFF